LTERKITGALSGSQKDDLLKRMRSKTSPKPRVLASITPKRVKNYDPSSTDFTKHPDFEQIQLQTMFADHTNLKSPYFRNHNARAGAFSRIDDTPAVNFGSYDYLGLNQLPCVGKAASAAIEEYGTSVSASRIVAGERPFHREFETKIASIYDAEDACVFVSGHATNVSTIAALLNQNDLILYDAWAHNSVKMGAKLSGATIRNFAHNNSEALDAILKNCRHQYDRVLIVIEGLYSMDGDTPDLEAFIAVKERYQAWLMVDEAHSLGVLGKTGRGIAEEQNVDFNKVDIWMGTLSKTLASCGGYIAGSKALIEILKFKAAGFVYSVGLSAPATAAALAAIKVMQEEPQRIAKLRKISQFALQAARKAGIDTGVCEGFAVMPIMLRDAIKAVVLADRMLERGYNMLPIIYPAVPMQEARLRLFINCDHTEAQIQGAIDTFRQEIARLENKANHPKPA